MKKQTIEICTPLGASIKVKAYTQGNLAVHKIPYSDKIAWTITHIPSGYGIVHEIAPFSTRKEAGIVASKLLEIDDWCLGIAKWGCIPYSASQRVNELFEIFKSAIIRHGKERMFKD